MSPNRHPDNDQRMTETVANGALPPGNSDRIRHMFGSYGLDVLENSPELRVSSLYSTHDGVNINRTFAVVAYPTVIDPAFAKEHAAIINGESIGIVFKQNGWLIRKDHQYFGEIETPPGHFGLHHDADSSDKIRAAIHVYALSVKKGEAEFQYASIAEIHHPDYLRARDLAWIYGDEFESNLEERGTIGAFLDIVKSRLRTA